MRIYQYDKHLDFHALGREIKRKREEKGWTQEYLAQLVDRTPRSIMYMENRGQKPSLNVFYQLVTLLEISVDQFFFPDKLNGESTCRKQIDVMLNSMDEKELTVMKYTAEGLQKARETEDVLFENAKNSPIYEMADVKARIERKLLQKEKWSFLGFFSLREIGRASCRERV